MIKRVLLIAFFLFAYFLPAQSGFGFISGTGGMPGAFMSAGPSARGYALGNSQIAYADDIGAIYYNPACLILDGDVEAAVLNQTPFEGMGSYDYLGTQYNFLGLKVPVGVIGTFAAGLIVNSVNDIKLWNENITMANPETAAAFAQSGIFLSYGKRLFLFPYRITGVGLTIEMINQDLNLPKGYEITPKSTGYGLDVGAVQELIDGVFVGLNLKHIVPPMLSFVPGKSEAFPMKLMGGISIAPYFRPEQGMLQTILHRVVFSIAATGAFHFADYHDGLAVMPTFHFGLEKALELARDYFAITLRFGLNDMGILTDGAGFEFGFTYGFGLELLDLIRIDVATDTSSLGMFNRIYMGLSLRLDFSTGVYKDIQKHGNREVKEGNFFAAKDIYLKSSEYKPKRVDEAYIKMREMDKRVKQEQKEVTALCEADKFREAAKYIRSRWKKAHGGELERIYIPYAVKDLKTLQDAGKMKDFALRMKVHLYFLPDSRRLREAFSKFIAGETKRGKARVAELCRRGRYEEAHRYNEKHREEAYYPQLVDTYTNAALAELRRAVKQKNLKLFLARSKTHLRLYPGHKPLRREMKKLSAEMKQAYRSQRRERQKKEDEDTIWRDL